VSRAAAKKRLLEGAPPNSLFFGEPIRPETPPTVAPVTLALVPVWAAPKLLAAGEPTHQAWHDVAAECPEGRSAAEHCWPVDGRGLVHVVSPGDEHDQKIRCVTGERNPEVGGCCLVPIGGLKGGQRTTHAQRLAELGARV
jgi:hypothetical protein